MNDQPAPSVEAAPEQCQPPSLSSAPMVPAECDSTDDEHAAADAHGDLDVKLASARQALEPLASAADSPADAADDGFLADLMLPSLVSAPKPLAPSAEIGPDGRARVVELLGTRGRVNLYA